MHGSFINKVSYGEYFKNLLLLLTIFQSKGVVVMTEYLRRYRVMQDIGAEAFEQLGFRTFCRDRQTGLTGEEFYSPEDALEGAKEMKEHYGNTMWVEEIGQPATREGVNDLQR